jgi:hypothetical protein
MAVGVAINFIIHLYYPVGYISFPRGSPAWILIVVLASYGLSKFAWFETPPVQPLLGTAPLKLPLPALTTYTNLEKYTLSSLFRVSGSYRRTALLLSRYIPLHALQEGLNPAAISYAVWNRATGYPDGVRYTYAI